MIATNASLGGFGGPASKQSKLPTLGSLATTTTSHDVTDGKENQENDNAEVAHTVSLPVPVSESAAVSSFPDAHEIDNSPSFVRSSPSSTIHGDGDDTLATIATYEKNISNISGGEQQPTTSPSSPAPKPTPSPLAATLLGSTGHDVPPSPILSLQDPWGRNTGNGEEEFADLSSIADLTREDESIITATSMLVGDLGNDGTGANGNTSNSGVGGIAGQKLTFLSTALSEDGDSNGDNIGNKDSKAEVDTNTFLFAEQTLLKSIGNSDPTSALHEHYQSIGKANQELIYRDIQHRDSRGIVTGWWRSVLSCPIMSQDYESGLPRSALLCLGNASEDNADPTTRNGWSNVLTKLGEHIEFDDGYVYFKSKKGARKAAALCAYEGNIVFSSSEDGTTSTTVMYRCKSEAVAAVGSSSSVTPVRDVLFEESPGKKMTPEKAIDTDEASLISSTTMGQRRLGYAPRLSYPKWVERLHRHGVHPFSIDIHFREKKRSGQPRYLSKEYPTELCCVMNISGPLNLTAVSIPFQSRSKALESASLLVEEEVRRQNVSVSAENESKWETKEGLIRSAPEKTAAFVFPPPSCFTAPIEENSELYAYELEFKSISGKPFIPSAMCLSPTVTTRMAVVFGEDLFCDKVASETWLVETTMELPTRNGTEKVKVALRNRTTVDLSENDVSRKIHMMKCFNSVLCDWKRYGFVKWSRSRGSVSLTDLPKWPQYDTRDNQMTCLFVPLKKGGTDEETIEIDWNLMLRVVGFELQPYLRTLDGNWRITIGRIRSSHIAFLIAFVAAAYAYYATHMNPCAFAWNQCIVVSNLQNAPIACMWLAFHAVAFLLVGLFPPKKTANDETIMNRFLLQSAGQRGIFAVKADGSKMESRRNAYSTYTVQHNKEGAQSFKQSVYNLYLKNYGTRLHRPNERLLPTSYVKKHANEDILRAPSDAATVKIPPELVYILPCPRDILYMCGQHMDKIMLPLQRAITLLHVEDRLQKLKDKNCMKATAVSGARKPTAPVSSLLLSNLNEGKPLSTLLDEATRLFPQVMYQRLEFLGDAVLNYFLSVDLMARNTKLNWDADELGDLIQVAMNNQTLGKAALRIGLSRLLGIGGSKLRSAYSSNTSGQIAFDSNASDSSSQLRYSNLQSNELSEGTLSDVVESLLAVAFIISGDNGSAVVGLLNELELPGIGVRGDETTRAFHGLSACLGGRYPFELQKKWNKQIVAVGTTLIVNHEIDKKLELGYKSLCGILEANSIRDLNSELSSPRTKILLRCALFDDSLDFGDSSTAGSANIDDTMNESLISTRGDSVRSLDGSLNRTTMMLDGLDLVGILRDTLFFVGNYALNLCISIELYKRYPNASPTDLTLLNFCAFTDDVMAYILVKNKIHDCLYDQDSSSAAQFWIEVNLADEKGLEIWGDSDGWILGGINDYHQRVLSEAGDAKPRYPGIGGGLLTGKLSKLNKDLTEDLAFSLKAICGALVLGTGVDGMWAAIGPLLDEVLILTPKENQRLYGKNSVCSGWK